MARHERFQPPGPARLGRMRERQHVTRYGAEKVRYTPTEADEVVGRMNRRPGRLPVVAYDCPVCGWVHVGTSRERTHRTAYDPVVVLESGERVEACIRLENQGTQAARIAQIVARGRAAERRSAARVQPLERVRHLP